MWVTFQIAAWIAAGALGWVATAFVATPVRRFFTLKEEVVRQLAYFGNVGVRSRPTMGSDMLPGKVTVFDHLEAEKAAQARQREAADVFRKLASEMRGFAKSETLAVLVLKWLRYDPLIASSGLFGFSNEIGSPERAAHRKTIEKALRIRN